MFGEYDLRVNSFECHSKVDSIFGNIVVNFQGNLFLEDKDSITNILRNIAYDYSNPDTYKRFNGQFVFVVFDSKNKKLVLVRDHLGIIPLYYTQDKAKILFGTHIGSIIDLLDQPISLNEEVVHEYFVFRYISGEATLFKNIMEVKPGCIMEFNEKGNIVSERYYTLNYTINKCLRKVEATELFSNNFENIFKQQTFDKSNSIGVLSSGGIDSSILVACSRRILGPKLKTYYIGNKGYEYNRIDEVNYLKELFDTNHKNYIISNEEFSSHLINTIAINEEPLNHPSSVLRNYLYKQINSEVSVLLSGEGADCFYCGYYVFNIIRLSYQLNPIKPITKFLAKLFPVNILPNNIQHKSRRIKDAFALSPVDFVVFKDILTSNSNHDVVSMLNLKIPESFASNYTSVFQGYSKDNIMDLILFIYQTYYIIEALKTLTKLGIANQIEHRHPFIDVRLVNLFNEFPWNLKIQNFKRKPQIIELGKKYIPNVFIKKRKEGFGVPLNKWFYEENGMGKFIELLNNKKTRERGIFNCHYLDDLLHNYHKSNLPEGSFESVVWPIINFELWCRYFIDKDLKGLS